MKYKRVFLNNYSYFITIVTYRRIPILIDNIEILRDAFKRAKKRYNFTIDAIVILPDHMHMIITPEKSSDYPKIVSHVKRSFVYGIKNSKKSFKNMLFDNRKIKLTSSQYRRKHSGIWQERFYEHTIRDEKDYLSKLEYIYNNPVKHNLIDEPQNWQYSSFYRENT